MKRGSKVRLRNPCENAIPTEINRRYADIIFYVLSVWNTEIYKLFIFNVLLCNRLYINIKL